MLKEFWSISLDTKTHGAFCHTCHGKACCFGCGAFKRAPEGSVVQTCWRTRLSQTSQKVHLPLRSISLLWFLGKRCAWKTKQKQTLSVFLCPWGCWGLRVVFHVAEECVFRCIAMQHSPVHQWQTKGNPRLKWKSHCCGSSVLHWACRAPNANCHAALV